MTAPARAAAHGILRDVHTGRADLPQAQARARLALTDPRDRALTSEIATGTLRWRAALDHVLAQVSSRPLTALDADILDLLRASAYQLLYLDRVPDHAVVDDAVALTRTVGKRSAAGFVNAVLRAITNRDPVVSLPPRPAPAATSPGHLDRDEALDYLSTTLSHPRWLLERWLDRYGFEAAEQWASFNNEPAPITLRVNTLITSLPALVRELEARGIAVSPGRWSPQTLVVTRGNPLATDLADRGLFLVQNEASQLVAELVAAGPYDRVLDACASPGGKAVVIAGAMSNQGLLVAADLRPRRLALLSRTLARCRCDCAHVVRLDLCHPPPFTPVFDWVLVDAPCSGLGTLRRDPEIRWRRSPADLPTLAAKQSALLAGAATVASPGGRLVYATCSSEPEENEQVVEQFLRNAPQFTVEPPAIRHVATLVDSNGYFQCFPHRDGLEAFFAVVLRRGSD